MKQNDSSGSIDWRACPCRGRSHTIRTTSKIKRIEDLTHFRVISAHYDFIHCMETR